MNIEHLQRPLMLKLVRKLPFEASLVFYWSEHISLEECIDNIPEEFESVQVTLRSARGSVSGRSRILASLRAASAVDVQDDLKTLAANVDAFNTKRDYEAAMFDNFAELDVSDYAHHVDDYFGPWTLPWANVIGHYRQEMDRVDILPVVRRAPGTFSWDAIASMPFRFAGRRRTWQGDEVVVIVDGRDATIARAKFYRDGSAVLYGKQGLQWEQHLVHGGIAPGVPFCLRCGHYHTDWCGAHAAFRRLCVYATPKAAPTPPPSATRRLGGMDIPVTLIRHPDSVLSDLPSADLSTLALPLIPSAFADLDRVLQGGAVPDRLEDLVDAMTTADALCLSASDVLFDALVTRIGVHWDVFVSPETRRRAADRALAAQESGDPTPLPLPKRSAEDMAIDSFLAAVAAADLEAIRSVIDDHDGINWWEILAAHENLPGAEVLGCIAKEFDVGLDNAFFTQFVHDAATYRVYEEYFNVDEEDVCQFARYALATGDTEFLDVLRAERERLGDGAEDSTWSHIFHPYQVRRYCEELRAETVVHLIANNFFAGHSLEDITNHILRSNPHRMQPVMRGLIDAGVIAASFDHLTSVVNVASVRDLVDIPQYKELLLAHPDLLRRLLFEHTDVATSFRTVLRGELLSPSRALLTYARETCSIPFDAALLAHLLTCDLAVPCHRTHMGIAYAFRQLADTVEDVYALLPPETRVRVLELCLECVISDVKFANYHEFLSLFARDAIVPRPPIRDLLRISACAADESIVHFL